MGIKSWLGFLPSLHCSVCSCEERQSHQTLKCGHRKLTHIHWRGARDSPRSCAENSSLNLLSGTALMCGKEAGIFQVSCEGFRLQAVFWRTLIPSLLICLSFLWGMYQYRHSVAKETVSSKQFDQDYKGSMLQRVSWVQTPPGLFRFPVPKSPLLQGCCCLTTYPWFWSSRVSCYWWKAWTWQSPEHEGRL